MKITVIGAGYVGLSNAVLLSDKNKVVLAEINPKKIALLRAGKSPIFDPLLQENLSQRLHLSLIHISEPTRRYAIADAGVWV